MNIMVMRSLAAWDIPCEMVTALGRAAIAACRRRAATIATSYATFKEPSKSRVAACSRLLALELVESKLDRSP
ncbi:MAG TPA: hypothetical protein PK947_07765, partial [Ottowia sp.]|nr:hypothetical protein [Ottowia sp.]